MKFPPLNKFKTNLEENFGENIKEIEKYLRSIDVVFFLSTWLLGLVLVCITLFSIVFSVNLALSII